MPNASYTQLLQDTVHVLSGATWIEQVVSGANMPDNLGQESSMLHMPVINSYKEYVNKRGVSDFQAFVHRLHDVSLYQQYLPGAEEAQAIYKICEIQRIEELASRIYAGVAYNIKQTRLEEYQVFALFSSSSALSALEEQPLAMQLLWMIQLVRQKNYLSQAQQALVKAAFPPLWKLLQPELRVLFRVARNQEHYAKQVLHIIALLTSFKDKKTDSDASSAQDAEDKAIPDSSTDEAEVEAQLGDQAQEERGDQQASGSMRITPIGFETEEELPQEEDTSSAEDITIPNQVSGSESSALSYTTFTQEFDEVVLASSLADEEEIQRLRKTLDQKHDYVEQKTKRYFHQFRRLLIAQSKRSWDYAQEEGVLDASTLARKIADPNYAYFYKREYSVPYTNTVVSLLLDNSGSMRGRPITMAALSADILAQYLEGCGIKTEVLGFTSVDWKGGRSRKRWLALGSRHNPGRLNDIRHIVYKSAAMPWRKARKHLGVMLKDGILKENIDGEALLWAASRLAIRPEERKILLVVSDGAPVDDSTIAANSHDYLDRHLHDVIHTIENQSDIELAAIGIGHDVTRYYRQAVTIKDVNDLGSMMFKQLADIFRHRTGHSSF